MAAELEAIIRREAPMPFHRFMRLALYHPTHGYFVRRVPGPQGDFETAPTISPLFGRCIARLVESMWHALGGPETFEVREAGPGGGQLARDTVGAAVEPFAGALRWTMVEPYASEELMDERVRSAGAATWARRLDETSVFGCVLANEVLDNLPVRLCRFEGGQLLEADVVEEGAGLVIRFQRPATDPVSDYVRRYAGRLHEGQQFEVGLDAQEWFRRAAAVVARGYLVVIDYGDVAPALFERRPAGTLLAYRGGRPSTDVTSAPGMQDLTAHVNFSALVDAGTEAGLRLVTVTTQRELLLACGLPEELDRLRDESRSASGAEALKALDDRGRASLLVRRGGMGDFRVVVMARDAPDPQPLRDLAVDVSHDEVEAPEDGDDVGDVDLLE